MKIVVAPGVYEETIKKSRFIGSIYPCVSESEASQILRRLHEQHPAATHIVYAYRIQTPDGLVCRFHDAGEPGGTAGKPIFQHLEGKQLINVLIAVVRYFGGVKLGAGGLTRAYGNVTKLVIENAALMEYVKMAELHLDLRYGQLQMLEYQLKKLDGSIIMQEFAEQVRVCIRLPEIHKREIIAAFQ